ncbi:MAG: HAMP domain-containing protein [Bacteroidota bacterium]|nr:HAMP domain-containing protein [Bacteroidota bacterium]
MQIKTRLTLLFTVLAAALLLIFSFIIYFSSAQTREEEYFKRLKQQASTKADLLFDTKLPPNILQLIYKKAPNTLFQEEVAVYDSAFHLLYHDAVDIDKIKETKGMIDSILTHKEIHFYVGKLQAIGFEYVYNHHAYVVTAAAHDEYGLAKLATLRNTLIIALLVSIIVIFLAGEFFAKQSLKPVQALVDKVKKITASNLDSRVEEGNRKDEIAALAITFNEMLNRLENSFDAQKQFVSNISHELRTPLSAIISELELALSRERSVEHYREVIQRALSDAKKLARLSSGLLDFAKASYDQSEIAFKETRLDEVLMDARQQVLHVNGHYKIHISFTDEVAEDDDYISVSGNEYLLKVAFLNLMENACKFSSDQSCRVQITHEHPDVVVSFADTGKGIAAKDLPHIFEPFYRGENKQFADGNGIGLSLTQKIIQLHHGTLEVQTEQDKGSVFILRMRHV